MIPKTKLKVSDFTKFLEKDGAGFICIHGKSSLAVLRKIHKAISFKQLSYAPDEYRIWTSVDDGGSKQWWLFGLRMDSDGIPWMIISDGNDKFLLIQWSSKKKVDDGAYDEFLDKTADHILAWIDYVREDKEGYYRYKSRYFPYSKRTGSIMRSEYNEIMGDHLFADFRKEDAIRILDADIKPTVYEKMTLGIYSELYGIGCSRFLEEPDGAYLYDFNCETDFDDWAYYHRASKLSPVNLVPRKTPEGWVFDLRLYDASLIEDFFKIYSLYLERGVVLGIPQIETLSGIVKATDRILFSIKPITALYEFKDVGVNMKFPEIGGNVTEEMISSLIRKTRWNPVFDD